MTLLAYTSDLSQQSVMSDAFELIVRQSGGLGVNVTVSPQSVEPGENVTITIKGLPNSVFGLSAVDESTRLLLNDDSDRHNNNNDLNEKKLSSGRQRFDSNDKSTSDSRSMLNGGDTTQKKIWLARVSY